MKWVSTMASQVLLVVKNLPANAGDSRDTGLTPGSGRYPRLGNGDQHQNSCLENPMDIPPLAGKSQPEEADRLHIGHKESGTSERWITHSAVYSGEKGREDRRTGKT